MSSKGSLATVCPFLDEMRHGMIEKVKWRMSSCFRPSPPSEKFYPRDRQLPRRSLTSPVPGLLAGHHRRIVIHEQTLSAGRTVGRPPPVNSLILWNEKGLAPS